MLVVGAITVAVSGEAMAQPAGARPIEQGVGDAGPLSAPGRVVPVDLRKPLGFERVYTLGRVDAFKDDEVFLRVSGGITAVFPRSVYEKTPEGTRPLIPPGTTFYIGELPEEFRPAEEKLPPSRLALNLGVDLSAGRAAEEANARAADQQSSKGAPEPATAGERRSTAGRAHADLGLPTIWENEEYRGARIGQIMRRAMAGR